MREIRIYMPEDLINNINERCEEIGINRSEYLRTLANLDISIKRYQQLTRYANLMYNTINNIHEELGVFVTPLQEVPMICMD